MMQLCTVHSAVLNSSDESPRNNAYFDWHIYSSIGTNRCGREAYFSEPCLY